MLLMRKEDTTKKGGVGRGGEGEDSLRKGCMIFTRDDWRIIKSLTEGNGSDEIGENALTRRVI